jgi:hypothetical protein
MQVLPIPEACSVNITRRVLTQPAVQNNTSGKKYILWLYGGEDAVVEVQPLKHLPHTYSTLSLMLV